MMLDLTVEATGHPVEEGGSRRIARRTRLTIVKSANLARVVTDRATFAYLQPAGAGRVVEPGLAPGSAARR